MNWIISWLLLTLPPSISEEVKQFSEKAGKQLDEDALIFLKDLYDQASSDAPAKCKKCLPSLTSAQLPTYDLMVFMSFSVPLESWKDWSQSLEKMGGIFVLRGLPGNSFQAFAQKVKDLKNAGVNAPICIDPEAYEKYGVEVVPSIVIIEGEKYHKIAGNIRMERALSLFNEL